MEWATALLLKLPIAVVIALLYYLIVYRGSLWLGRYIKSPRLYDFLFRERGRQGPTRPADPRQRLRNQ